MTEEIIKRAQEWLDPSFDAETRQAVQQLLKGDPRELEDSFYKNLEFGTGGLRGIMGAGTNRMNRYTVGMATQGLADYVKKACPAPYRAAISYDCRNASPDFARITAEVLAANDFTVYLSDTLRPTPELSFAVRQLGCNIGVMITASHNPKEYNGYKVYWNDGAQVVVPHDKNIINEVLGISSPSQVRFTGGAGRIETLGAEMDELYLSAILSLLKLSPDAIKKQKDLKMVYTPLHGTGVHLVPEALRRMGFCNLYHVPAQDVNDGNFPTVVSPNPEEPEALRMAVEKAAEVGACLVMATDPDADRVGVAVRNDANQIQLLNGNQTAALLTWYLLMKWKENGQLKGREYIVKTIVTSDLLRVMALDYGVECYEVLTGFKYIAQVVREQEGKKTFIGGGEESFGYNVGEFVRDKDAVVACALIAEAAAWAAEQGRTLFHLLTDLYVRYGFFKESLMSRTMKGKDGMEQMKALMNRYRMEPPRQLLGSPVVLVHDYLKSETVDMVSDLRYTIQLPKSDVIQFVCMDNTVVTIRPSGTEPKIKYYFGVRDVLEKAEDLHKTETQLDRKIEALKALF